MPSVPMRVLQSKRSRECRNLVSGGPLKGPARKGLRVRVPPRALSFATPLVQPAMSRLKTVAVGTKDSQVLEPIVEPITVDVIELDGDAPVRRTFAPATELA